MKIGEYYTHLESGNVYCVVALGLMKDGTEWRESVTYQSNETGNTFTQKHLDFVNKFHRMDIK